LEVWLGQGRRAYADDGYAKEELVAELGADVGLPPDHLRFALLK
jgi:hypothetical protein